MTMNSYNNEEKEITSKKMIVSECFKCEISEDIVSIISLNEDKELICSQLKPKNENCKNIEDLKNVISQCKGIPGQILDAICVLSKGEGSKITVDHLIDYVYGKMDKEGPYDNTCRKHIRKLKNTFEEADQHLKIDYSRPYIISNFSKIKIPKTENNLQNLNTINIDISNSNPMLNTLEDKTCLKLRNEISNYYLHDCGYDSFELLQTTFDTLKTFVSPSINNIDSLDLTKEKYYLVEAPNSFGKSTFLKCILLSLINESSSNYNKIKVLRKQLNIKEDIWLPLFLDFKELGNRIVELDPKKDDIMDILRFLTLKELYINNQDFLNIIQMYNNQNRLVLLVDGFDEINRTSRERIIEIISLLRSSQYTHNMRIIVSSRPIYINEGSQNYRQSYFRGYKVLQINSLSNDKNIIKSYVYNYLGDDYEYIVDRLSNSFFLQNFAKTPYILATLIVDLSNTNTKIYQAIHRIIEEMISRFVGIADVDNKIRYLEMINLIYQEIGYLLSCKDPYIEDMHNSDIEFERLIYHIINLYKAKDNKRTKQIWDYCNISELSSDIYTHHSLIDTTDNKLSFISPEVLIPYYSAFYILNYFHKEYEIALNTYNEKELLSKTDWETFNIINQIDKCYMIPTVSFVLLFFMNPNRFSTQLCNLDNDQEEIFLNAFVYNIKHNKINSHLINNIAFLSEYVFNQTILGEERLYDVFYKRTNLRFDAISKND